MSNQFVVFSVKYSNQKREQKECTDTGTMLLFPSYSTSRDTVERMKAEIVSDMSGKSRVR